MAATSNTSWTSGRSLRCALQCRWLAHCPITVTYSPSTPSSTFPRLPSSRSS